MRRLSRRVLACLALPLLVLPAVLYAPICCGVRGVISRPCCCPTASRPDDAGPDRCMRGRCCDEQSRVMPRAEIGRKGDEAARSAPATAAEPAAAGPPLLGCLRSTRPVEPRAGGPPLRILKQALLI